MDVLSRFGNWVRACNWRGWLHVRIPQPFVGIAFTACAGVLLGEYASHCFARGPADTWPAGPWMACAIFFFLSLLFAWIPRRLFCWLAVLAAFSAIHLFRLNDPASTGLVEELARASPDAAFESDDTGDGDPPAAYARTAGQTLRARGVILDEPRASTPTGGSVNAAGGKNWRFTFGLSFMDVHGRAWRCRAKVCVFWRNGPETLATGDRLELTGVGGRIARPRDLGEFDMAGWLRRADIRTELRCSGISDVQRLPSLGHSWWAAGPSVARRFQAWTNQHLTRDLEDEPDVAATVSTIMLGLRSAPGLGGDLEDLFQRTGTLHFFAIDGLKLGLFAIIIIRALSLVGMRRQWSATLILPVLVFYALATGLGPASLRAVIFATVVAGGEWLGRPARSMNSLGAAATFILLFDTNQLFQLSFQLTFLVVLSILLLGKPLYRLLIRIAAPDPFLPRALYSPALRAFEWLRGHLVGLACVSLAAAIGSFPIIWIYFNIISPISFFANVAVFPLAFGMIALDALSLTASIFSQTWSIWINNSNWLLAKAFLASVRCFDAVPGGSFYAELPTWRWERPAAEITVLDLPYGSRSTHLRTRAGGDWLIDAGKPFDYQRIILPYLHSRGLNRLDGLILAQGDGAHLGGAPLVLAGFDPRRIVDFGATGQSIYLHEFLQSVAAKKVAVSHWHRGDELALGRDVEMRVLYPPQYPTGRAAGDNALVMQLRADGWRVLFLGDSGKNTAQWLAKNETADVLRSDIVVAGSATENPAAASELLRAISPRLIVQAAPKGDAQHSAEQGAAAARPGMPILSATRSGAITLRIYPDRIEAHGFVDDRSVSLRR